MVLRCEAFSGGVNGSVWFGFFEKSNGTEPNRTEPVFGSVRFGSVRFFGFWFLTFGFRFSFFFSIELRFSTFISPFLFVGSVRFG